MYDRLLHNPTKFFSLNGAFINTHLRLLRIVPCLLDFSFEKSIFNLLILHDVVTFLSLFFGVYVSAAKYVCIGRGIPVVQNLEKKFIFCII